MKSKNKIWPKKKFNSRN